MAKRYLKKFLELRFDVRDDKAREFLGGMEGRRQALFTGIPNDIGKEVGTQMRLGILDNFSAEAMMPTFASVGYAWPRLGPKYAAWKERFFPGQKIGHRTGQLKASISWVNEGARMIAGVIPGGGGRGFDQGLPINTAFNALAGKSETGKYRGLTGVEPVESYAHKFNASRRFDSLPKDREYAIRKTVYYWIVGKGAQSTAFGRDA